MVSSRHSTENTYPDYSEVSHGARSVERGCHWDAGNNADEQTALTVAAPVDAGDCYGKLPAVEEAEGAGEGDGLGRKVNHAPVNVGSHSCLIAVHQPLSRQQTCLKS